MRVVVIGGFGNFGARICRRLCLERNLDVIATGRGVRAPTAGTVVRPMLDLDAPGFAAALRALAPNIVIHCAGPFQGQDYRVVSAALACGAHYIDLADGRAFVADFATRNHAVAVAADRVAISGASTLPALSSAVIDHLAQRFASLDTIEIAIAPGQRAPRGTATIAAVLGYAGQPFQWWHDGQWRTVHGWQELRHMRFPFGTRCAAACDVPDLALFPQRYSGVRSVTFYAALELALQHYALWCTAVLRRMGLRLPVERWAGSLNGMTSWLDRFGSDCGGMIVNVTGFDSSGARRRASWQLVAKHNHGPEIPCMAAVLVTNKLAKGALPSNGAYACMGMLDLAEFEPEFARWDIEWRVEENAV